MDSATELINRPALILSSPSVLPPAKRLMSGAIHSPRADQIARGPPGGQNQCLLHGAVKKLWGELNHPHRLTGARAATRAAPTVSAGRKGRPLSPPV